MKYIGFPLGLFLGTAISVFIIASERNHYHYQTKVIEETVLYPVNEKVQNLNNGGCGFFALKLYQRLTKKNFDIVIMNFSQHIMLREKKTGLLIDSDGFHTLFEYQIQNLGKIQSVEIITESHLYKMVYKGTWNKKFNWNDTTKINDFIYGL